MQTSGHFEAISETICKNKTDNTELLKSSASGQIQLILKKVRHFLIKMSKTATTPREKSKLVTKTVTPQQANVSLATNASISQDEEADDGLFVDVDSLQVHNFHCLNFLSKI